MNKTNAVNVEKKHVIRIIIAAVVILALLVAVNIVVDGKLLTMTNFKILVASATPPTLVAWGFCIIFTGNITDLSPGAVVILAATVSGILGNQFGVPAMVVGGLAAGMGCMFLNFAIYRITKVPPWIAGLGMTMVYEAVIGYYASVCSAKGQKVVTLTGSTRMLGMEPWIYVMLVLGFVIAYLLYNYTSFGIGFRAVGDNENVARVMGIKIDKTLMLGGLAAGFFFGFAGFVKEGYAGFVNAQSGLASLSTVFQPMAAVLLAMALSNYINVIVAVPISTFLIILIFNILTLLGVPSGTFQETLLGLIVICFAVLAQRRVKGVVK
ncbi:MAG: ABC transporter permease [Lachnospiraceae bacterium]|nr:ABC transporter permease [Lachnospiraceae bacterium]